MANFTDASATKALNEDKYINKLYDTSLSTNKDTLSGYYKDNTGFLDTEQKRAQGQTADYVARTNVEADKAAGNFQEAPVGRGTLDAPRDTGGQEALTRWNQRQADVTALQTQQSIADAEIQRQRSLLAQEYQRAIQQAQADNDMQRAQALYDAAKAEEDQLLALRKEAGVLMAQKGDRSILEELKGGTLPQPDTTSESWAEALKNEESINKIYDAQAESQRLEQEGALERQLSDLYAQRDKAQRATDQQLTQAYVDAQRRMQAQNENMNAHGLGSGAQEQARLARDMGLQAELTRLRTLQGAASAAAGVQGLDLARTYRDAAAKQQAQTEQARAKALYDAAEGEEQRLVDTQKFLGEQYAKKNDYSILGALYGLTPEQLKKLKPAPGGGEEESPRYYRNPEDGLGSLDDDKGKKPTPAIQDANPEIIKWLNGLR